MPARTVSGERLNSRTVEVDFVFTYEAAIVSIGSGCVGGQYADTFFFAADAPSTLMTATSGPGVSGIPFSVYTCAPRTPPTFSHTVIVPVPGLNTLTQSEKSPNLKFVHVCVMLGPRCGGHTRC